MLKDIVEDQKKQGAEFETVTVYCPYCHQGMAAEATLDMVRNEELLKELAIESCQCPEAQYEAKRKQRVESVDEKVNTLLGEGSDVSVDDEILDLIKSMSIHICYEKNQKNEYPDQPGSKGKHQHGCKRTAGYQKGNQERITSEDLREED